MTKENLALWERLGKTDPKQTKGFKRAGGFTGTAVKPIYTTQKMTEEFGPAGQGWGMGEPVFQVVPGVNNEVLVYCTVSLWYVPKPDGVVCTVFGVGGDKVVSHIKANEQYNRPERWENDDEAFKKAFTDATGNAMKHIGMSADVHMGRFDDSKYVRDVAAELAAAEEPEPASRQQPPRADPEEPTEMSNTAAKAHWKTIYDEMAECTTLKQLQGAWNRHYRVYEQLPESLQTELRVQKDEMKDLLMAQEEARNAAKAPVPPNFNGLEAPR